MPSQGFAIRRGSSCLPQETICGDTVAPFRGCCPSGFACPKQYNIACCPPGSNCTSGIALEPLCANATWDLYDNNGVFCCEPGAAGFKRGDSDGCAEYGLDLENQQVTLLKLLQKGNLSSSDAFNPAPYSAPKENKSSTPVGAIVGGVIGGVALLALLAVAFYFLKRKRRDQGYPKAPMYVPGAHGQVAAYQLGEGSPVYEADARDPKMGHRELAGRQGPIELLTN
ncbi:uncharacterized protein CC84DRAFT_1132547 [Paraphaeosphaeria sporulosa]|uniref:Mid2 domain-containing protein n=1 Tax=Paraphaeosphaeria sporulosa TaxID=1460663 RepID=A0A177BT60_9PLEO|nr:uncharacterized protein CC84DRAFT_1132547 [Paraphaeosphaeria sporulosa]OAF98592.1 hypothetical protein CC84DRAFT_1132547 [Paraphaeosphaeria sporulosa]